MRRQYLKVMQWWISAIALTMLMTTLMTALLLFSLTRPALETIHSWQQPAAIAYDGSLYHLAVLKMDRDWRGFPFNVSDRYGIFVGLDPSNRYGHWLDFTFYPFPESLDAHIKQAKVDWADDGVTFAPPSGHRLFIPKAMFIGGR